MKIQYFAPENTLGKSFFNFVLFMRIVRRMLLELHLLYIFGKHGEENSKTIPATQFLTAYGRHIGSFHVEPFDYQGQQNNETKYRPYHW
jgi:hypothetical protein